MAKRAKAGTGLRAAQQYLGLVKNAQGQWVRPGAGLATKTLQTVAENMGYQGGEGGFGATPLANLRGERLGTVSGATGQLTLAGGRKATSKRKGATGRHARSMAGATAQSLTATTSPLFAEADIATTGYVRAQGKAYAAGRGTNAGTLAGQAGGGETIEPTKSKRGRRRKGMLKTAKGRSAKPLKAGRPRKAR